MNGMSRRILKNSMAILLPLRTVPDGCDNALPPSGRQTVPIDTVLSFFDPAVPEIDQAAREKHAENMLVRMPMQCTTAKPRTGPEPKISRPDRQSAW
jgi:hypothetical protein